jgi:hypothetical protein
MQTIHRAARRPMLEPARRGTFGDQCLVLAHRVIRLRRSNLVAFGVKRTFSEPRLQNRIYEYAS